MNRTRIQWLVATACVAVLAAVWIWFGATKSDQSIPPIADRAKQIPLPPITASLYRNTQRDVRYVGTERCMSCHADQHASYLKTAHSRSLSVVDPHDQPPDGEFDHAASGRRYRVYRQDGKLRHRESLLLTDDGELQLGDFPLAYLVGSGRFTRTYLVEDDGFLIESPVTWYSSLGKWAMSPGYDRAGHRSFYRTIDYACLFCHAGTVDPIAENEQRLRLGDLAIGCERCHGPGELHVAHWTANTGELDAAGDRTIVNPKRLPRDLAESICQQCHLTGATQVAVRGRRAEDFRPGLRWSEFVVDFDYETKGSEMTVVGHVSQMHQSPCYQGSDTLTCVTCHDPHSAVDPAERIAEVRTTCLQCHAEPSCSNGLPAAERSNRNCATCHMPQSRTDIQHVAFTHHRIGLHKSESVDIVRPGDTGFRPLVPVLDVSRLPAADRQRSLGLAYLQFQWHQEETDAQAYLSAARPFIEDAAALGLMDASLALAQAELAAAAGESAAVKQWAREALTALQPTGNERITALRFLAGMALEQNQFPEAATHLEELVKLARDPRDWFLLGVCRTRQGDAAAAITAFERVIAIDPAQPETYELLGPLLQRENPERAKWCLRRASLIRQSAN